MRFLVFFALALSTLTPAAKADQGPGFGGTFNYLEHVSSVYCSIKPDNYMGPPAEDGFIGKDSGAHISFSVQHVERGYRDLGKKVKQSEYTEVFVYYPKLDLERTLEIREWMPDLYNNAAIYDQIYSMGHSNELDPSKIGPKNVTFPPISHTVTGSAELKTLKFETLADGTIRGTIDGIINYRRYVNGDKFFQQKISFSTICSLNNQRWEIHR